MLLLPNAWAEYCPKAPGGAAYELYVDAEYRSGESSEARGNRQGAALQAVYNSCPAYAFVASDKGYASWLKCGLGARHPSWPAEINFCPNGAQAGSKPGASGGQPKPPAKAKCNKKDIEGKWQRTRDGTQVGLYGGFGRMVKFYGSVRWPLAVGKFYRVKHISGSCDWSARCTTVRMRTSSKSYNWSAEPCTLRLSADKKTITTSDNSGTWTRGWK